MDSYKYQPCIRCGVNAVLKRSAGRVDGSQIFLRYNWICSACINRINFTPSQRSHLENLDTSALLNESTTSSHIPPVPSLSEWRKATIPNEFTNYNGLRFCHLNCNSVRNKFEELRYLLSEVRVAVLACTESKLDTERDSEAQYQVKYYNTVRCDRTVNNGGGTFILIHESFSFEVLDLSLIVKPELTEVTTIKVWKKGLRPIVVTTIYNVPKTSILKFNSFLQQLLLYLSQFDNEKIIFGDMNIDLIKHNNQFDVNVHKYLLLLSEFGFRQVIQKCTFRDLSLLDHLAINDDRNYRSHGQFPFAGSDHQHNTKVCPTKTRTQNCCMPKLEKSKLETS
jgi:hypothetical protein